MVKVAKAQSVASVKNPEKAEAWGPRSVNPPAAITTKRTTRWRKNTPQRERMLKITPTVRK
jgi:hypothetical protein